MALVDRPAVGPRPRATGAHRIPVVSAGSLADLQVVSRRAVGRNRHPGLVVAVRTCERRRLVDVLGRHGAAELDALVATELMRVLPEARLLARDDAGRILLRLPGTRERAERRLALARHQMQAREFSVAGLTVRPTLMVGYVALARGSWRDAQRQALDALAVAETRGDLVPVAWAPELRRPVRRRSSSRLPAQVAVSFLLGLGLPYLLYVAAGRFGVAGPVTTAAYVVVSVMMVLTTVVIHIEGLLALAPVRPPKDPPPAPPASVVIAAYLPNEAATIVDTVTAFLAQPYSGDLQVVLAYNRPRRLPVEDVLEDLARRDDRLLLLPVEHSTSKAQNVNAALEVVTGEMVGLFDADHHPADGSLDRAWRWLAAGYGVVQGHCTVRNGAASWVARLVAVEFEAIYAVSHPGRAQLHGFGVFGGSNGYWRTDLLRQVRMRTTMLTEDIDSSFRVTLRGVRIANDPALVSRELAPATLGALVHQRLRWAQGWSQVSRRYLGEALRSPRLRRREKVGALFLLGWREVYPWVSLQVWPLVAYAVAHPQIADAGWFAPGLVLSTLVAALAGPSQAVLAYALAVPELRRRPTWFLTYAALSALFYTELKNALARVAHLRELLGESEWRVTPREATR